METLYLVDGSNFLFRAYHALPPMNTSKGVPTGAVFGFTNMLLRLLDKERPSHVAVLFDAGGRSARTELYPEYKANRAACPEDLRPQFDLTRRVVRAMGVPVLDARDVEADDLMASLGRRAQREGLRVVLVTSDKDLMQLCGEDLKLLDTMKEGGQGKLYGPPEVEEKFGVPPAQLGDVLALMGDSSDNVPGVPGVGPKTAAQLVQQFGSLDGIYQHLDEIKVRGAERVKGLLKEHEATVRLARRLVTLDEGVGAEVALSALRRGELQQEELAAVLRELEFNRIAERLAPRGAAGAGGVAGAPSAAAQGADAPPEGAAAPPPLLPPRVPGDVASLRALIEELLPLAARGLGLSVQLAGLDGDAARTAPLCGLALFAADAGAVTAPPSPADAAPPGAAEGAIAAPVYVPLGHRYLGAPPQLDGAAVAAALGPLLADPAVPKYVAASKDARLALASLGLRLDGVRADPTLCSYLLDAGEDHGLQRLAERHLRLALPTRDAVTGTGRRAAALETVEQSRVAELAAGEAQASLYLGARLRARLDDDGRRLLDEVELPLAQVLATIERHGVLLDSAVLRRLSGEVSEKLRALEAEIGRAAGYEVNLSSPKQLQELLFEKLGLPATKKTKTGYSTDAEVLETLAEQHPIAAQIHEHRGLLKLKNTYIDQLPQLVDPRTGRLHTSYQQVVAATGRLSSTEPNLQNVPIRTELGREIRRAFIAPPGHVLIAADYSQIELRVLAHLSRDPLLLDSFLSGQDVHERTAVEMFGEEEGRRPDKRRAAKMINYGIVYGLSDYGLAVRLSIERTVAKRYIQEYFARYQGVSRYMAELVDRARRDGGARTVLGRFRPLPDLATRNYSARSAAERMAKNTPIQGSAADILKLAMIAVQRRLESDGALAGARMLLTVHDELVLEAREEQAQAVMAMAKEVMEGAYPLAVPLVVDAGQGRNWADCD